MLAGSSLVYAVLRTSAVPLRASVIIQCRAARPVTARFFSTHVHHPNASAQNKNHSANSDIQSLVERDHFMKVRNKLENDKRNSIPYSEFVNICNEAGLTPEQAAQLCNSLSDAGVILHFKHSTNTVLQNTVYIKPAEFNNTVSKILGQLSSGTFLQQKKEEAEKTVAELKAQFGPLNEQRERLEGKANTRANTIIITGLLYCVLQAAAVARLTWWELSWDIMEPVTYMLTFATALIGYSYFVLTGTEYTYEGLKHTLRSRKLVKLIKNKKFDEESWEKLAKAIRLKEEEVARLASQIDAHPSSIFIEQPKLRVNLPEHSSTSNTTAASVITPPAPSSTSSNSASPPKNAEQVKKSVDNFNNSKPSVK